MSLVKLEDLSLGYGAEPVFEGVALSLAEGDRLGLVGSNGSGKSSLLKCISGSSDDYSGSLTRQKGLKSFYVHQGLIELAQGDVTCDVFLRGYLTDAVDDWKIDYTFESLKFPKKYRELQIRELSGGWNKMLMFAAALISEPDLLILDEPTNHLDMYRTDILVDVLQTVGWVNTLLVASHDRFFLDAVTQQTLFLDRIGVYRFPYSYSRAKGFMYEKERELENSLQDRKSEIERLTQSAKLQRQLGVNNFSDKASQKAKQIEKKIRVLKTTLPDRQTVDTVQIKLETESIEAKYLIKLYDFKVNNPSGELLFTVPELEIKRGDRIVITGANGSGKSSFLRVIAGLSSDALELTPSARVGYFEQSPSRLSVDKSILDFVLENAEPDSTRAVALLASAGFTYLDTKKSMLRTSFGERARLSLLALRQTKPNFLLLDEPTNHLDIKSQEMLEDEIRRMNSAALIVSHDRRFVENVGNRFFSIKGGVLVEGAFHGEESF
ncbi:ATPase [Pseudomonas fluorescens]|uniref:ATPase n=1 Tax=Pseudomonas fluorescens TaxID=294 RepID=A0A423N2R8_PSEFL|nr:ATP-binding cassette domain-containing protein [Pseudomonas fluorescens]RON92457.1 ATPase [Pseudomonas fluorescens]